MSDDARDRLTMAAIAGATARHVPLSGPYPVGEQAAIADVQREARGRADLLAQFAGYHLGLSVAQVVDAIAAQMMAQASLAARAGADMDQVARWIPRVSGAGKQIHAARRPR